MHLNRPGEISSQEAEELRQHVRLCERCALELQRIERAGAFTDRLGAYTPAPVNPEKLTADILRSVRAQSIAPQPPGIVGRLLDFFFIPSVRYAAVTVILLVSATSATQLVMVLNDISDLEHQMAAPLRGTTTEAAYTAQSKTLQTVAQSEANKSITTSLSLTLTNDRIDVSAKDADTFLTRYNLDNLSSILGSAALRVDSKTLEKIVNEVKTTAALTFRVRREGV